VVDLELNPHQLSKILTYNAAVNEKKDKKAEKA